MQIHCRTGATIEVPFDTLEDASLDGLGLHRADLTGKSLRGASLCGTDLRGAELSNADLTATNLTGASLITAFADNSKFKGAILRRCRAMWCHFENSDLSDADFSDADIECAHFEGSRLHGANLNCDCIESAHFHGALFDRRTQWPKGFDPIAAGAMFDVGTAAP